MDTFEISNIGRLHIPEYQIDILNAERQRQEFEQRRQFVESQYRLPEPVRLQNELLNNELNQRDLFWEFWCIEQQRQRDIQYLFWSRECYCECVDS